MKDKLTKRRIKVDYPSMIIYLKMDGDFIRYLSNCNQKISYRRQALAFLRSKKVDIAGIYYEMKEKGIRCDNDMTGENRHPNHNFEFDDVPEVKSEYVDNTPDWIK